LYQNYSKGFTKYYSKNRPLVEYHYAFRIEK